MTNCINFLLWCAPSTLGANCAICGGLHTQIGPDELELVRGYDCSPGRAREGFLGDAKQHSLVLYAAVGGRQLIGISANRRKQEFNLKSVKVKGGYTHTNTCTHTNSDVLTHTKTHKHTHT